jgi:hypothetical protein
MKPDKPIAHPEYQLIQGFDPLSEYYGPELCFHDSEVVSMNLTSQPRHPDISHP